MQVARVPWTLARRPVLLGRRRTIPILSLVAAVGCGGAIDPLDAGVGDANSEERSDGSNGFDAGPPGDGGWTSCASPQGYRICRGDQRCPDLPCCMDPTLASESMYAATICNDQLLADYLAAHGDKDRWGCFSCEGVCVNTIENGAENPGSLSCVPYEIGVLYADAGAAYRVRYADIGLWRDEPIPAKAGACPSVPGFTLCGPGCGTCSGTNERCIGRAPLHPTGVCMATTAKWCNAKLSNTGCNSTQKCFTFTVEPQTQAVADEYGNCVDATTCAGLAASIPGGGRCK